jgi:hypothetical protein
LKRDGILKNKKLTVRKIPFEGESLSSFLYRLSKSNGIPMLQFWNTIKNQFINHYAQWNDINLIDFAPINTINVKKLSQYLDVEAEIILKCTFYNVLCLFCGDSEIERSRFLSGILREVLHYCPSCFKEKAYNRLLWKINGIDGCLKHGVKLLNKCFHCDREIKYKDISNLGVCPYCEQGLFKSDYDHKMNQTELEKALWLSNNWSALLKNHSLQIQPNEIAMKILYLLNNQIEKADFKFIEKNMKNPGVLPNLLQHARGSLSNKRTLHISFILNALKENEIEVEEFLELEVPSIFIKSLRSEIVLKKDQISCLAPWCSSYQKPGSLKKTGTSLKRKENGRVLKYYLVCDTCGCEYALNEVDQLEERTYFIKAFNKLNDQENQTSNLKEIMLITNDTADKVKRCFAYFRSRNVLDDFDFYKGLLVKKELLNKFIKALDSGESIKAIRKWDCWESYNNFLTYRYHNKVIQTIHKHREKILNIDPLKKDKVIELLESMFEENENISLNSVCERLGVCVETIRNWGCNNTISEMKEKQKVARRLDKNELIYSKVDSFLLQNKSKKISAAEIYNHIKIQRTILWRIAPEITAYIDSRRRNHNKQSS